MGYSDDERVKVKLEFLRMITRMELNPSKMELIYGFFETYLKLNETEEEEMNKEISKLSKEEADRVLELPNSYREKGREEGLELAKKRFALNMLNKKMSNQLIAELAELDVEEIIEIKEASKVNKENNK